MRKPTNDKVAGNDFYNLLVDSGFIDQGKAQKEKEQAAKIKDPKALNAEYDEQFGKQDK